MNPSIGFGKEERPPLASVHPKDWDIEIVFHELRAFSWKKITEITSYELVGFFWFTCPYWDILYLNLPALFSDIFGVKILKFQHDELKNRVEKGEIVEKPWFDPAGFSPPLIFDGPVMDLILECNTHDLKKAVDVIQNSSLLKGCTLEALSRWNFDVAANECDVKTICKILIDEESGKKTPIHYPDIVLEITTDLSSENDKRIMVLARAAELARTDFSEQKMDVDEDPLKEGSGDELDEPMSKEEIAALFAEAKITAERVLVPLKKSLASVMTSDGEEVLTEVDSENNLDQETLNNLPPMDTPVEAGGEALAEPLNDSKDSQVSHLSSDTPTDTSKIEKPPPSDEPPKIDIGTPSTIASPRKLLTPQPVKTPNLSDSQGPSRRLSFSGNWVSNSSTKTVSFGDQQAQSDKGPINSKKTSFVGTSVLDQILAQGEQTQKLVSVQTLKIQELERKVGGLSSRTFSLEEVICRQRQDREESFLAGMPYDLAILFNKIRNIYKSLECGRYTTPQCILTVILEDYPTEVDKLLTLEVELFVSKIDALWNTSALRGIVDSNNFNREIVEVPRINVMDTIERRFTKAILDHPLLQQLNRDLIETVTQLQALRNRTAGYTIPETAGEFAQKPAAQPNEDALLGYGPPKTHQGLVYGRKQGNFVTQSPVIRGGYPSDSEDESPISKVTKSLHDLASELLNKSVANMESSRLSPDMSAEKPAEVAQIAGPGPAEVYNESEDLEDAVSKKFLLNATDMYESDVSLTSDLEGFEPAAESERKAKKPVAAARKMEVPEQVKYRETSETKEGNSGSGLLDLNDYDSDALILQKELSEYMANYSKVLSSPDPPTGQSSGVTAPPSYFPPAETYIDSDDSDYFDPNFNKGG